MNDTAGAISFYRGEDPLRADKLNAAFAERILRAGDTMDGFLTLAFQPVAPMHAATKQYIDTIALTGIVPGSYLPVSGGTITSTSVIPALTINTNDNGVNTKNGLLVKQTYAGSNLTTTHGATGWTGSFQYGNETFHDHFAVVFNTVNRSTGQYNNLESVMTIPAGTPVSGSLTNAFTASIHDYGGNGALAALHYAIAGVSDSVVWATNTVCTDRNGTVPLLAPLTNVREQIENDFFVSHPSCTVRGVLNVLSATDFYAVPPVPLVAATAVQWIGFAVSIFPNSARWNIAFSSGNGGSDVALLIGTTGPFGNPVSTGNISQPIVFQFTNNTTPTTQHTASLYLDPTYAGAIDAELRLTKDAIAPLTSRIHMTLQNLASFKSMNAAGTASIAMLGLNAQDQVTVGGGASRTNIMSSNGTSATFISGNPNAVNEIQIMGNAAGQGVQIQAHPSQLSPDTNINLSISSAGTGSVVLQSGGSPTSVLGPLIAAQGMSLLNTSGPIIIAGPGAPVSTQPKGSVYLRTNGAVGTSLYVSQGAGVWNAVAGV